MAERKIVAEWLEKAEEIIEQAKQTFDNSQRVQPGDPDEYIEAQRHLEEMSIELDVIMRAATKEQRNQLNRTQQQLRQLQNHFILRR
ncbi:DUF2524 family protein [Halalkalibacter nanhaiisediminis]|uniref:Uncharacterized protein DUF2524 n=1 Tax=Halalkalibacter nanhaiisediminis TaxID=688079 RepID=A0A562QQB2_9BACI|nr:DUF2524 family protein [Halalkalibacter nanhaiisediminis]TWI58924.1 uncharacterized protein DUF2524 [Halalkalibacter nanhaiisediminis]